MCSVSSCHEQTALDPNASRGITPSEYSCAHQHQHHLGIAGLPWCARLRASIISDRASRSSQLHRSPCNRSGRGDTYLLVQIHHPDPSRDSHPLCFPSGPEHIMHTQDATCGCRRHHRRAVRFCQWKRATLARKAWEVEITATVQKSRNAKAACRLMFHPYSRHACRGEKEGRPAKLHQHTCHHTGAALCHTAVSVTETRTYNSTCDRCRLDVGEVLRSTCYA